MHLHLKSTYNSPRTGTLQNFPSPVGLLFGKFYDVAPIAYAHTWLIQNTDTEQIIPEHGFSIAIYNGISWYVYSSSAPATKLPRIFMTDMLFFRAVWP